MNKLSENILKDLNDEQKKACVYNGSYVLTACPGSGKTRTIINRIIYINQKYPQSELKNVGITYTNRAAEEIIERLNVYGVNDDSIWIGTIHQFCLEFILRPYSMFIDELKFGFEIISEYEKRGIIHNICDEFKINYNYFDSNENLLNINLVKPEYLLRLQPERKIDFKMILEYSLLLLTKHPFIAKKIAYIFRSIQVDEYQDTQMLQYDIIKKIFQQNNRILLSFVGDPNQAIYKNLGSVTLNHKEIEKKYGVSFKEFKLKNCYRSPQNIIDYYIKYQNNSESILSLSDYSNTESNIHYLDNVHVDNLASKINAILIDELEKGTKEKEICILTAQNQHAMVLGNKLKKLNQNINFDSPEITPFKYDPLSPYYLIARLLFTKSGRKTKLRKKMANEIIKLLNIGSNINIDSDSIHHILKIINSMEYEVNGLDMLRNCSLKVIYFLDDIVNMERNKESLEKYLNQANERMKKNNISMNTENLVRSFNLNDGVVISTYHGAKGEEYEIVICTGLLNGYIPHWDLILNTKEREQIIESNYLLYVAFSRAKRKIYIIPETGRETSNGNILEESKALYIPTTN